MLNDLTVDQYNTLLEQYGNSAVIACFIATAISAVGCFFGYKLAKFMMALIGFLLGIAAGGAIGISADNPMLILPVGILLGILFAILSYKLFKVGVFITTFLTAGLFFIGFVYGLSGRTLDEPVVLLIIGAIGGFIAAVIAVIFTKPIIIINTALSFGTLCGSFLAMALKHLEIALPVGIAFAVVGLIFQIKTNDGLLEHEDSKPMSQTFTKQEYVNPYASLEHTASPTAPKGQYNDFLGKKR